MRRLGMFALSTNALKCERLFCKRSFVALRQSRMGHEIHWWLPWNLGGAEDEWKRQGFSMMNVARSLNFCKGHTYIMEGASALQRNGKRMVKSWRENVPQGIPQCSKSLHEACILIMDCSDRKCLGCPVLEYLLFFWKTSGRHLLNNKTGIKVSARDELTGWRMWLDAAGQNPNQIRCGSWGNPSETQNIMFVSLVDEGERGFKLLLGSWQWLAVWSSNQSWKLGPHSVHHQEG